MADFKNLTRRDMGDVVGKNERTIGRWVKDGCPRNKNGKFSAPDVIQWLLDRESTAMAAEVVNSPALERYRNARAEMAELELKERRGSLVSFDEMVGSWCARYRMVRDALLSLIERLPGMLENRERSEIRGIIKEEIYYILNTFAKDGKWTPREAVESECKGETDVEM